MMKFVTLVRHRHGVNDLAERRRVRLYVDHRQRVGFREIWTKQQSVGEVLRRSFHRKLRRCMKRGIWPDRHRTASLFCLLVCTNVARRHAAGKKSPELVGFLRVPPAGFAFWAVRYTSNAIGRRRRSGSRCRSRRLLWPHRPPTARHATSDRTKRCDGRTSAPRSPPPSPRAACCGCVASARCRR